jgi:hypothetical protein
MTGRLLTKSEYARRCGVKPGAVGNWIARGKLTRPAIRRDGRIDAEVADLQLADRRHDRSRPPGGPIDHSPSRTDQERDHAEPIGAFVVVDELPALAQALRLDRGQVSALNRWFAGRRTAGRHFCGKS